MKILLIGSMALKHNLDSENINHNLNPLDCDLIVSNQYTCNLFVEKLKNDLTLFDKFEEIDLIKSNKFGTETRIIKVNGNYTEITYPISKNNSTQMILDYINESNCSTKNICGFGCFVANNDLLYTLKMSHRFLKNTNHFLKTMFHIKNLRILESNIIKDIFDVREKETYDYSHPSLNVVKSEFFNSNFNYIYDHDSIHESVKILDKPAYTYYMNGEVNCSKDKFFELDEKYRLFGVLEETYVLALERSQIPNDFNVDPRISFNIALEKVCTSITSGWFREYAWENYEMIQKLYDESYVDKFKYSLKQGLIKKY